MCSMKHHTLVNKHPEKLKLIKETSHQNRKGNSNGKHPWRDCKGSSESDHSSKEAKRNNRPLHEGWLTNT